MDDATAKMVNSGHFTLANLRESRLYRLSPFTHRERYKRKRDALPAIFDILLYIDVYVIVPTGPLITWIFLCNYMSLKMFA